MTENTQHLTKRSLKAGVWLGGYRVYARTINLLKTPIITRIFLPAELGVFGIVAIALNLFETFAETGLEQALIHRKDIRDEVITTAWYLNIIRSVLLTLILFLSAPVFARVFSQPEVLPMIQVISVIPIIRSLRNPNLIYAKRALQFGKETVMLGLGSTVEVITTLVVALMYDTVWALVWAIIAGGITELLVSYILFSLPKLQNIVWKEAISLFHFGKWVWSSSALSFLSNQGDDMVVAKLLGTGPLGLYQYAYKIASLPATQIAGTVSQVTFPAFAAIQEDPKRLKRAFRKSFLLISATTVPPLLLTFLFPEVIVTILFGENWIGAAVALRILSIYGIIRAYGSILGPVANAIGKPQLITLHALIQTVVLFILLLPLSITYGVAGASIATVVSISASTTVLLIRLRKHII